MNFSEQLTSLIDQTYVSENGDDGMRYHLGGSVLGDKCLRAVWFGYLWAAREEFDGRMLRLFEHGQREELVFTGLLRSVGATVWTVDEDTGQQFRVKALGGHVGGSLDGVAMNVPFVPTEGPCLLEMKTHNLKSFTDLKKKGVKESKPRHYNQAQFYMGQAKLSSALYCAVNKNDEELHFEHFNHDPAVSSWLLNRAEFVVFTNVPPPRISEREDWYECRFCAARGVCFGRLLPPVNCRTCEHAKPLPNGTWVCLNGREEINTQPKQGCSSHATKEALLFQ